MKTLSIIALVVFTLVVTSCLALASAKDIADAEMFYKKGQYDFAISKLRIEIAKPDAPAKAHYLLGQCYTAKNRLIEAQEQFIIAVTTNPSLGDKVSDEFFAFGLRKLQSPDYRDAGPFFGQAIKYTPINKRENRIKSIGVAYTKVGLDSLANNQVDQAKYLLAEALQIAPEMVDTIAEECLLKASEYLKYRQYDTADRIIEVVSGYGEKYQLRAAELYYELGKECRNDTEVQHLQKALKNSLLIKEKVVSALSKKFRKIVVAELEPNEQKKITAHKTGEKWIYFYCQNEFYVHAISIENPSDWYNASSLKPISLDNKNTAPYDYEIEMKSRNKNLIIMIMF